MKKILLAVIFTGAYFFAAAAEQIYDSAGLAFSFMNIGVGARAAGMGGAFTAAADDISSIYWNPAGLSKVKNAAISMTYNSMYVDTSYQYLLMGIPAGPGTLGFDAAYLRYGSFELRDSGGALLSGTATPYNFAAIAGYGMKITEQLSAGVSVKYLNQDINNTLLNGFAFDLGVIFESGFLSAGISAQNIGTAGDFSTPLSLIAGVAAKIETGGKHFILLAVDASYLIKGSLKVNMGAEYSYADMLFARAGYSIKDENNALKGLSGISGGLGFKLNQISVDYSIVPFGDLGTVNNFSISYNFGDDKNKVQKYSAEKTLPDDFMELIKRGDVMQKTEKYEEAIAFYRESLSFKKNPEAYRKTGDCYYKLKNREMAIYYYEKSLEMQSDGKLSGWLDNYRKSQK